MIECFFNFMKLGNLHLKTAHDGIIRLRVRASQASLWCVLEQDIFMGRSRGGDKAS